MDKRVGVDVQIGRILATVFLAVGLLAAEAGLDVAIRVQHPPSVIDCK